MKFPYLPVNTPDHIICNDCGGDGWGPMLTEEAWESITDEEEDRWGFFLCEDCMSDRFGRPVYRSDLADCAMNKHRPVWKRKEK